VVQLVYTAKEIEKMPIKAGCWEHVRVGIYDNRCLDANRGRLFHRTGHFSCEESRRRRSADRASSSYGGFVTGMRIDSRPDKCEAAALRPFRRPRRWNKPGGLVPRRLWIEGFV
jgi:hypothetical protein